MSAKKKNLVPLFAVAFIVAIVSTGIFYGLFVGRLNSASVTAAAGLRVVVAGKALPAGTTLKSEDLRELAWPAPPLPAGAIAGAAKAAGQVTLVDLAPNELLTNAMVASRDGAGGGLGIPDGMRAVSLNVHDSAGVIAMLKPGHRVDVQVVGSVPGPGQEAQLRTMLENIRILAIPADAQAGRGGSRVVTVLATPQQAAQLGLADSTARVRMVLRNPVDSRQDNPQGVALSNLFRGGNAPALQPPTGPAPASSTAAPVALTVKLGVATSQALDSWGAAKRTNGGLTALVPTPQPAWESLESTKSIEWLAVSNLTAALYRETGTQWTANRSIAGIRLVPVAAGGGRTRLRLFPETITPAGVGQHRNRLETELEIIDGQWAVVRGLSDGPVIAALWEKLFPGKVTPGNREMVVVVSTRRTAPAPVAAASRNLE